MDPLQRYESRIALPKAVQIAALSVATTLAITAAIGELSNNDTQEEIEASVQIDKDSCGDIPGVNLKLGTIVIEQLLEDLDSPYPAVNVRFGDTEEAKKKITKDAAAAVGLAIAEEKDVVLPEIIIDSPTAHEPADYSDLVQEQYEITTIDNNDSNKRKITEALNNYYTAMPLEFSKPETWEKMYIVSDITDKHNDYNGNPIAGFVIPSRSSTQTTLTFNGLMKSPDIIAHEKAHIDALQFKNRSHPCDFDTINAQARVDERSDVAYIDWYAASKPQEDWAVTAAVASNPFSAFAEVANIVEAHQDSPGSEYPTISNNPVLAKLAVAMASNGSAYLKYSSSIFTDCVDEYAHCTRKP